MSYKIEYFINLKMTYILNNYISPTTKLYAFFSLAPFLYIFYMGRIFKSNNIYMEGREND